MLEDHFFRQLHVQSVPVSEVVFQKLKKAIIEGKLEPGARLREQQVAEWLQISRTPLREAIQRLVQDGWLERLPGGGVRVTSFSKDIIAETSVARQALEGMMARLAATTLTDEDLDLLGSLTDRFVQAAHEGDAETTSQLGREIHQIISERAGNRVIRKLLEIIQDRTDYFRNRSVAVPGRLEDAAREHQELYEALRARDADRAERVMRTHIHRGVQRLIESLDYGLSKA